MEKLKQNINLVKLIGRINSPLIFDHESYGEIFYKGSIEVSRISGTVDNVPIIVSEVYKDLIEEGLGDKLYIEGEFRSYNKLVDGKSKLILYVLAKNIHFVPRDTLDINEIYLIGYLCKPSEYRTTPLNREITDFLLAVNRRYGNKADYLPLISWGGNSRFMKDQKVGSEFEIKGRIQSREYISGKDHNPHTAYEISTYWVKKIKED